MLDAELAHAELQRRPLHAKPRSGAIRPERIQPLAWSAARLWRRSGAKGLAPGTSDAVGRPDGGPRHVYAYSPIYGGDPGVRTTLLDSRCPPAGGCAYQFIIRGKARCVAVGDRAVDIRNESLAVSLRVVSP